jgi:hypothetical protein
MTEGMLVDILVFFGLMATLGSVTAVVLAFVRRRGATPLADRQTLDEIAARVTRIEQLAESTAIEVERIGEGQRFTTKLLSERGRTPGN